MKDPDQSRTGAGSREGSRRSCRPEVDLGLCTGCGGCVEVAPGIFRFNEGAGYLEIIERDWYDPELVAEAIRSCPEDAISGVEE